MWRGPILHKEPVHIIEARSILGAVKHRSRDHDVHGRRKLVLNDNMGVVLACQKGGAATTHSFVSSEGSCFSSRATSVCEMDPTGAQHCGQGQSLV